MEPYSLSSLLSQVRGFVAEHCPGRAPRRLVVTLDDGDDVSVPVYYSGPRSATPQQPTTRAEPAAPSVPDDAPELSRTERRILLAVAALETDDPTGEEIARQAKLPYESHFKKTLSAMRGRGLLGGAKGDIGYPITPLGLSLVAPDQTE